MAMIFSRGARIVDEETEDSLRRRFSEGTGMTLLAVALLLGLILGSFNPEDPSPFNITSSAATNMLGLFGSHIAGPFVFALGWAGWAIVSALGVWGIRMILHRGEERVISRLLMAVLGLLLGAAFLSTHIPPGTWTHRFGLGGTIGDSLLTSLMGLVPLAPTASIVILSAVLAPVCLILTLLGLGLDWHEFRMVLRYLTTGLKAILRVLRKVVAHSLLAAISAVSGLRGLLFPRMRTQPHRETQVEPEVSPNKVRREPKLTGVRHSPIEDEVTEVQDDERQQRLMARIASAVQARKSDIPEAEPDLSWEDVPAGLATPMPENMSPPVKRVADPELAPDDDDLDPTAAPRVQPRSAAPVAKSRRAQSEAQPQLALGDVDAETYDAPPLSLLADPADITRHHLSDSELEENARLLETVLDDYGIRGEIVSVRPGPVVTMYELEPAPGLKASRVIGLADDIARSMSALSARVSTVPGRSVIGIELPNVNREKVVLREILSAKAYGDSVHKLPLALGKDISGEPIVTNLARMPHLLIAGTTGSGKSVAINTMILSLLYQLGPKDCRVIMIDPKMLELSVYDGIPHLLSPVVTDPKKAVVALKWVVAEMEERYRKMSKMGVRNIDGYNARVRDALARNEAFTRTVQTGFDEDTQEPIFETEEFAPETLPYIVVIVDEMADLMMVAGKEIEACIQRLAQMARASGIHLIMATQRPSVDVITGTIKANFPTRISFQVTSKIDSRTILGEQGAEQLLGMGDMLYMAGGGRITRIHAPFCSDEEVEQIVHHLKSLGEPDYVSGVVEGPEDGTESDIDLVLGLGGNTNGEDALYDQAVGIVARDRKCSTSYIQRKLGIGYNKAARLVEQMEDQGIVTAANHVGKRDILIPETG